MRRLLEQVRDDGSGTLTERVLEVLRFVGGSRPQTAPPAADTPVDSGTIVQLVFGTYVGLVRQAPARGESDETHRVRRDALTRLGGLARRPQVGRPAVLPVLRRALSDPHHLVRKAALVTLRELYGDGDTTPLGLALHSQAADVGRGAVDELVAMAKAEHAEARALVVRAVDAPNAEVRNHAVMMIQQLFPSGSLEPWLVALGSRHTDVRLSVVDRLVDSADPRVDEALRRALESDHEDLRLRAAEALAARGEARTVDVLAAFLRREDGRVAKRALSALVALAHARPDGTEAKKAAATAVAARIEDDPDKTADRSALIDALARVGHVAGEAVLRTLLRDDQGAIRMRAFNALVGLARHPTEGPRRLPSGGSRVRYQDEQVLRYLADGASNPDVDLRARTIAVLRDVDDAGAEPLLARLLEDREADLRVAACEAFAYRAEHVEGASLEALALALREGRRELVLPAADGLAQRRRPEAFQALLLVLKAAEQPERERALLGLGTLGDRRALEDIEPLLDPDVELTDEDRALAPTAIEALGRILPHLDRDEEQTRIRALVERTAREGPSNLRTRALTGLRHAGDERSRSVLEAAVADRFEDAAVRQHAIRELGELRDTAAEAALAEALDDDARNVRREAVAALRKLFEGQTTRTNLLALRSRHADISAPAASFLAGHGDPITLVARMGEIDDADVRRRLRRGLVRRSECPNDSVRALLTTPAARADAAWLAGACGERDLAPAVHDAANAAAEGWQQTYAAAVTHDVEVRARLAVHTEAWRASLWASRRLGGAGSTVAARTALASTEVPAVVRREALRLLSEHGDDSDVDRAQALLSDTDAGVRTAAARLVSTRAPERSAAVVQSQTVADAAAIGPVAAAALEHSAAAVLASTSARSIVLPAALGGRRVTELSALASTSGKDPGRLTAIGSLGRLGGDPARTTLEAILGKSSEPEVVRKAAFRALRRLQRGQARAAALTAST